jgi:superfamily II DNA or RNA helicase
MTRELRTYQQEAVDAVLNLWGGETRRTAVSLPTGTGKSTVIAAIAAESARLGLRVVMLAHRAELLDQMAATVAAVDPSLPRVGIVRAETDEHYAPIVAASLQTLTNEKRHASLGPRDVVLWDEVHHGGAASWRAVLDGFGTPFFCGFTATLRREDGKALREIIDTVAYERNLRWAINEGFLVKPIGLTVKIPDLDLEKVKTTAGDFQQGELAEVMEGETDEVVKAILLHCQDRRPIIFAASVLAAHDIAESLDGYGFPAEAVTGAMSYDDRQPVYERYRNGDTRALVTVQVLTEGADFPMCDAVVIARPTQSQNLYSQMVGRALRLWETIDEHGYPVEKADALVLDLVGTSRVLKLVTLSSLDSGAPVRIVDTEGEDLPPEDWDEIPLGLTKAKSIRMGPLETIGIDLLGASETNILWLTTPKGAPFVQPQGADWFVFLWEGAKWESDPQPRYQIGVMNLRGAKKGEWLDGGRSWPLVDAKGIAEDYIIDAGLAYPLRTAAWRKNQAPSAAQLGFAENLGIANAALMTKARLSDEISAVLVANRLDTAR